ncbi:MAG: hypothetical protein O3A00_11695 [Planctomycetota bacterium]|nr:hypothetical protein [Planctomycetota bacterium]
MLKRALRVSTLTLGVCLLAASISEAQPGRGGAGGFGQGGRGGGSSKSALIGNRQVQEEIKITAEQVTAIQEKINELRRKQQEEIDALVAKSLSSSQNQRLDEIIFQQQGTQGLAGDAIAKRLGLSADQTKQIKAAFAARDAARSKLFESLRGGGAAAGGARPDFTAMREKMTKISEDAEKEALAVLTSGQKSKLESLRGKKFELQRQQFGRGGQPGGGRPGGGRPGGTRPGGDNGAKPRPEPDV